MVQNNKPILSNRLFMIIWVSFMLTVSYNMYKEYRETPENYLQNVRNSKLVVKEELAPALKVIFGNPPVSEGQTNRTNSSLTYGMSFKTNRSMTANDVKQIREEGWIEFRKYLQEVDTYTFCRGKYLLEVRENRGYTSASIKYSKNSVCWNFKETLENENYQLVN